MLEIGLRNLVYTAIPTSRLMAHNFRHPSKRHLPMLQDVRDNLELDRLQIENRKLAAEALKFMAEERKLRQEAFWHPFATGSVILTAIAGIMALLVKL